MEHSISIIICTRNRCDDLTRTLESLGSVELPAGADVELLVVDNGSTDRTPDVVAAAAGRLPGIGVRHLVEPVAGQSRARNLGVAESIGEVVLFTDDDVRPPGDWITAVTSPILSGECDAVAGGVRIADHLLRDWMTPRLRSWFASTDGLAREPNWRMVGANMAFSRRVLEKVPAFDVALGPGGLGFGDETLFSSQLVEAGYRTARALDVQVEHHFSPHRLSAASLRDAAIRMGRSQAYVEYHWVHYRRPAPRLRWMKHRAEYEMKRLLFRSGRSEGLPEWEMDLLHQIGLYDQAAREYRKPMNYDRRGLSRREHGRSLEVCPGVV
jgi:glycosyltransferase involved in cell wall biosynthesis